MESIATKQLSIGLLVLAVVLAGCSGGGGGGNGNGAETATVEGGNGGVTETTVTETATVEETTTDVETATTTPTPRQTESESSEFPPWSIDDHRAALREAGSYTLNYSLETEREASAVATVKTAIETGEQHTIFTSVTQRGNFTTKYYVPPNSDTAYKYEPSFDRKEEVSAEEAQVTGYGGFGTGELNWSKYRKVGNGETELGPATIYVLDDIEATAESFREQYDSIESFESRIWVDNDTGAIAKVQERVEYVDDGSQGFFDVEYKLLELGSTTIEEPDWVPSDDSE
jgi:hypothetical protein